MPEHERHDVKDLKILFPEVEVELADGTVVTVRPLSLEDLPKVMDQFSLLMRLVEAGVGMAEIVVRGIQQLMFIARFCIDVPLGQIPQSVAPKILKVIAEQNFTEENVKNWATLIEDMAEMKALGQMVGQGAAMEATEDEPATSDSLPKQ